MNVRNKNMEPATTNLELSLGYSNHRILSRSTDQGAGVNAAASRVDMTLVASDPLSELVWSPHNGLILKCADSSFVAKSPPLIWDVEPSKFTDKQNLVTSQATLVVSPKSIGGARPIVKPKLGHFAGISGEMDEVNSNQKQSTSKNDEKGMLGENDKDPTDHKEFLSMGTNEPLLHDDKGSPMPIPIPSLSAPEERNKDSVIDIENKNETKVDCSIGDLPFERLECTAENELPLNENSYCKNEERLLRGKFVPIEASPALSKTLLDRTKGKEKVLSKGDTSQTPSEGENDSEESVESCSSFRLFSGGKKRGRFEQQLILGSKRVKNHIQENPVSTSHLRHHSSFMNWISNMVKGSNRIDQDEEASLALTLANRKEGHEGRDKKIVPFNGNHYHRGAGDTGFHTLFRSIYCPKPMEIERKATNENIPTGESKELVLAERMAGPSPTPVSCHGYQACADMANGRNSSSSETKTSNDVDNKCDYPGSLCITQFSQKSHEHLVELDGPSLASKKVDDKNNELSTFVSNHVLPSSNVKNDGVMSSVFAKRLDALKHIIPSDGIADVARTMGTCFFCGKTGHDLRNCLDITETDRDNFIRNLSLYEGIEESHNCLCIRCFQVDHWAISCPKGLMFKQESHSQLGIVKAADSTSGDDVAKGKKLAPCISVDGKLPEVPKGMFDAIRKLRWSRMDMLKWMNSHSSLSSLDGYFLRLRLGKWEKGLGGTDYYVACITGERKEKQPQGSKRSIFVDIGGKSCLIESRCISNQDFLEDELMAWWSTAVKSGSTIPSGHDLKAKLEERIRLGF